MPLRIPSGLLIGLVTMAASPAIADPTLTLSSPQDLGSLTVGQAVEIDVTLSGLPANDFIFNLNSRVLFSPLFTPDPDVASPSGLTAVVAPGSVFYDFADGPAKIANFNYQGSKPDMLPDSSLAAGAATGIFSEYPNSASGAIGLNGLYYSFLIQANAVGSGTIAFDPTSAANEYAADDTGFNYAPLPTGSGLMFNILPAAVPEPSSLAMVALSVAILGGWTRARRRSAARAGGIGRPGPRRPARGEGSSR